MIYFILLGYVLPMLINGVCLYKDKSVKTIGDFVEHSWAVVIPVFNLFILFVLIISYIVKSVEIKFNLQTMWKNLMNKKIKKEKEL